MMNTPTKNNRKRVSSAASTKRKKEQEQETATTSTISTTTIYRKGQGVTKISRGKLLSTAIALLFCLIFVMQNRSNQFETIFNKYEDNRGDVVGSIDGDYGSSRSNSLILNTANANNKKANNNIHYRNNHRRSPQIVILAGPHKTASTTLQSFIVQFAGQTVSVVEENELTIVKSTKKRERDDDAGLDYTHVPHPFQTEWVWPLGYVNSKMKINEPVSITGMRVLYSANKFYAPLLAFLTGRRQSMYSKKQSKKRGKGTKGAGAVANKQQEELGGDIQKEKVLQYYRQLFQKVWNMNDANDNNNNNPWKKLVFGAEAFDTLVQDLPRDDDIIDDDSSNNTRNVVENLHLSPSAGNVIDLLLSIMPWDDSNDNTDNDNSSTSTSTSSTSHKNEQPQNRKGRRPSFKVDDLEIVINYRTSPRISHLISLWHQHTPTSSDGGTNAGGGAGVGARAGSGANSRTLQQFLVPPPSHQRQRQRPAQSLRFGYQLNSLGLALQFVRHGISTTIIDMKGVTEKEEQSQPQNQNENENENNKNQNNKVLEIGGLQGVVACDILHSNMCDPTTSTLMLPTVESDENGNSTITQDQNKKEDQRERNLTETQLNDIDQVMMDYDCSVWKQLQQYQHKGTLRLLYPSQSNTVSIYQNTTCSFLEEKENDNNNDNDHDNDNKKQLSYGSMLRQIQEIAAL